MGFDLAFRSNIRPEEGPGLKKVRLFCFPYAGGNDYTFRIWPQHLLSGVVLHAVNLPGRHVRFREPLINRLSVLVPQLGLELQPWLESPVCLFGHSLGGLIAFEVARELRRAYGKTPIHLFISGCQAPQLVHTTHPLHTLPDSSFRRRISDLIPSEARRDKDLMGLILPVLRSDFALYETYHYVDELPLDCPISAFGGRSDAGVSRAELRAWQTQTSAGFNLEMFPGDHFFLRRSEKPLIQAINRELSKHVGNDH